MPRVRAHFPGVHSGPLWSCILVILRVQPGTSISDHFGLHFGAPFPGPFGGPCGNRFLDLPVVLGTPFGIDFRPPFGIQLETKMDAIWVCYVRPFGPILRIHLGVEFGLPWRLLRPGGPRRPPEPPGLGPPEPSKMLHFGPFWASGASWRPLGPPGNLRGAIFEPPESPGSDF
mgnify:CR=1 FL=1